jgi:hypothetical protein
MVAEGACDARPLERIGLGVCRVTAQARPACNVEEERAQLELAALGKRGETIARARGRVLQILQEENACSAWFRELDLDPAETLRSVRFVVSKDGPRYVLARRLDGLGESFKHPWVAGTVENSGRGATVWINANGAFFNGSSEILEWEADGGPVRPVGTRILRVGAYAGNTPEAQVTTLLHELGHIVGRIPEDNDSTDGESGRNTAEVLRYCRPEIKAVAGKGHRGGR